MQGGNDIVFSFFLTGHTMNADKARRQLNKLLHPRGSVVSLCAALTAAGMVYVFAFGHSGESVSYAIYLFSAYSLTIAVIALVRRIKPKIEAALHKNALVHRYLTDVPFRTVVMLYWSLAVGVLYAVMKFTMGV